MTAPDFTNADEYNKWVIDNAAYYGVSLFLGGGEFDAHTCRTIDEAREIGAQMVAHHRNGRKPLIYALTKEGRHALVTEEK